MKKSIFLSNQHSLHSPITGGVQLCSQEFHHVLKAIPQIDLIDYFVPFTKNIFQRLQIKAGFENYSMYDVHLEAPALLDFIAKENISVVFLNMASIVRFAKPIKERFGQAVKTFLLSHGNHSGDFLHLITKPLQNDHWLTSNFKKIRLGNLIATESVFRVKYLDGVITLSETEKQIENWFGAEKSVFLPRKLSTDFVKHEPIINRIGFVGRLDHPPNLQGIQILLNALQKQEYAHLDFRLVGAPVKYGEALASEYSFIKYLGELSDQDMDKEITTWAFFINPVWWYSTGASTKLGKAISWGIPIVTTTAGMRGYLWKEGELLIADTPDEMAAALITHAASLEKISYWSDQTRIVAVNGLKDDELVAMIQKMIA